MADQRSDRENKEFREDQSLTNTDKERQTEEGLVGQTGEDRNLSGSSTYRTLPDQGPSATPGREDQGPGQG